MQPFVPARFFANRHLQTIVGRWTRQKGGVRFDRERITTPDGDFLDLDFAHAPGVDWADETAPIVLLLHGLEGSAGSGYACETYRQLARRGVRAVGLNFRSCSGELNRGSRLYHSGETQDPAFVIDLLRSRYPDVELRAVGFSLGGNVLLKYLGERGPDSPLSAAVAVSVPFDLAACADSLVGVSSIYADALLKPLRIKAQGKRAELAAVCDVDRAVAAKNFRDFDDALTAPIHGFKSGQDYYDKCSSQVFLPNIRTRTLLIQSADDPFLPRARLPLEAVQANDHLELRLTDHGGHVGFMSGFRTFWAESTAADFLSW